MHGNISEQNWVLVINRLHLEYIEYGSNLELLTYQNMQTGINRDSTKNLVKHMELVKF